MQEMVWERVSRVSCHRCVLVLLTDLLCSSISTETCKCRDGSAWLRTTCRSRRWRRRTPTVTALRPGAPECGDQGWHMRLLNMVCIRASLLRQVSSPGGAALPIITETGEVIQQVLRRNGIEALSLYLVIFFPGFGAQQNALCGTKRDSLVHKSDAGGIAMASTRIAQPCISHNDDQGPIDKSHRRDTVT